MLSGLQFLLYASGPTDFCSTFAFAKNWYHIIEVKKIVALKFCDVCLYIQYILARLRFLLSLDAEKMIERGLDYEWAKSNILCDASEHFTYDSEFDLLNLNEVRVAGEIVPFGTYTHKNAWEILIDDKFYTYTRRRQTDEKPKKSFDTEKAELKKWLKVEKAADVVLTNERKTAKPFSKSL